METIIYIGYGCFKNKMKRKNSKHERKVKWFKRVVNKLLIEMIVFFSHKNDNVN